MKINQLARSNEEYTGPKTSREPATIEDIIDTTRSNDDPFVLSSGRLLKISSDSYNRDLLTVSTKEGRIELEVTITERGPVLRFNAADMEIASKGKVLIDCEEFSVHARNGIKQTTEGNFHQQVEGDAGIAIKGDMSTSARICNVKATRGNINLDANDDVKVKGERIRLNC